MKKAQLSAAISDFAWYGGFVIVLVVFCFLFSLAAPSGGPKSNVLETKNIPTLHGQQFILNYLKTSVIFEDTEMNMADFIALSYERNQREQLKNKIKDDFSKIFDPKTDCYYLQVWDKEKRFLNIFSNDELSSAVPDCINPFDFNRIEIPLINGGQLYVRFSITFSKEKLQAPGPV